jgi:predicted Fe-S protein YdhL (DUF1289 family)
MDALTDPCINICRMDLSGQFCQGCRRTPLEIGRWPRMTLLERAATLAAIAQRRNPGSSSSSGNTCSPCNPCNPCNTGTRHAA